MKVACVFVRKCWLLSRRQWLINVLAKSLSIGWHHKNTLLSKDKWRKFLKPKTFKNIGSNKLAGLVPQKYWILYRTVIWVQNPYTNFLIMSEFMTRNRRGNLEYFQPYFAYILPSIFLLFKNGENMATRTLQLEI